MTHQPETRTSITGTLHRLLRQTDGPFAQERQLAPAGFDLGMLPRKSSPDATAQAVCGYCSTGCSLTVHLKGGRAVGLTPTVGYPVNLGEACPKGWEALSVLKAGDRATMPLLKDDRGRQRVVDWDTALRTFVERFRCIQREHGNDSVAFLSTGQIPTEEMALLGALAKFGMGMVHGDGNTRQCMATAVTAYKESFGFDAPPYTYRDFEESDVLVLVGANPCIAHPILWQRVMRNPDDPRIIVVDPRRTETAMQASEHLAVRPKSDLELFYAVAHVLIENDWIDREFVERHTRGFEEFAEFIRAFPPERAAAAAGLDVERIRRLARTIHEGRRVSFWWTMGVNQSYQGVRTAQSLINLALLTGNIGKPGTGANSITGQCNAMGSRLFSNTTNLLGGRDFRNESHREDVARLLNVPAERIPQQNGWPYDRIIEGVLRGEIKGLWVIATNPAHSWSNQNGLRDILDRLEFLVVQDMYATTETAQRADLVLPAAGWGEKEGTFINSERRVGVLRKVAHPPGEALADFAIFKLVAHYWGCGELFAEWDSPQAIFQILKRLSQGRPCDFSGIRDYRMIEDSGGIQWPFADRCADRRAQSGEQSVADEAWGSRKSRASHTHRKPTERRLFEDGRFYHPDGRARFCFEETQAMPEPPTENYPLVLLTGRGSVAQWHTRTRTDKSPLLRTMAPRTVYAEINPADARRSGVRPNGPVVVESQRGRLRAKAFVTQAVKPGQVFISMHFEETNRLTDAVFDPYSRQPSYKACAVRIQPPP